MFRAFAAAVLVAVLAGCASTAPPVQTVARTTLAPPAVGGSVALASTKVWEKCQQLGFKPGTEWFQNCLSIESGGKPAPTQATALSSPVPAIAAAPPTYSSPSVSGCSSPNSYGSISCTTGMPKTQLVGGYYRKNGAYVAPYYRSRR